MYSSMEGILGFGLACLFLVSFTSVSSLECCVSSEPSRRRRQVEDELSISQCLGLELPGRKIK
jgi:hypothetical protein